MTRKPLTVEDREEQKRVYQRIANMKAAIARDALFELLDDPDQEEFWFEQCCAFQEEAAETFRWANEVPFPTTKGPEEMTADRVRHLRTGQIFDVHSRTATHVHCYMPGCGDWAFRGIPLTSVEPVETYWCNVYRQRDGTTKPGRKHYSREDAERNLALTLGQLNSRIKVTLK